MGRRWDWTIGDPGVGVRTPHHAWAPPLMVLGPCGGRWGMETAPGSDFRSGRPLDRFWRQAARKAVKDLPVQAPPRGGPGPAPNPLLRKSVWDFEAHLHRALQHACGLWIWTVHAAIGASGTTWQRGCPELERKTARAQTLQPGPRCGGDPDTQHARPARTIDGMHVDDASEAQLLTRSHFFAVMEVMGTVS